MFNIDIGIYQFDKSGGDPINHDDKNQSNKTNWNAVWKEAVEKLHEKGSYKSWDKIAHKFNQWMVKDDYPQELVSKIQVEKDDIVFDVGCGNGTITIPLAKKSKSVTALDSSVKMLEILQEKAAAEKLSNIKVVNKKIENVEASEIGPHDVVVASRSLNGIPDIKKELEKIDEIAQKRVYITLWGVGNREFENEISKLLGRETHKHPDYTIVVNILEQMGIHANAEPLQSDTRNFYCDMEDALDRIEWRVGEMNEDEKLVVSDYISKVLTKEPCGGFSLSQKSPKWILVWWEKINS